MLGLKENGARLCIGRYERSANSAGYADEISSRSRRCSSLIVFFWYLFIFFRARYFLGRPSSMRAAARDGGRSFWLLFFSLCFRAAPRGVAVDLGRCVRHVRKATPSVRVRGAKRGVPHATDEAITMQAITIEAITIYIGGHHMRPTRP